ncbi:MAG TPA: hypothetical protein VFH19_01310 [Nitrososphaeraceae archaeon]|nr:hypothetical protein [Nitrososphaeraceae archaeon]
MALEQQDEVDEEWVKEFGPKPKEKEKSKTKKVIPISKYSFNGKGDLHEAVIMSSKPFFIAFTNGKIKLVEQVEENTRILRPPEKEEYPYKPYEFESIEELQEIISNALNISKDELYTNSKSVFRKYVDQDEHVINLLTMDSIWTYFQDLFPATHYVECIGTNDVGKSTIGYTFEYTGYRVIKATSISGANYYRMLGSIEAGQCVIIEDEGDNISEDPDKIRILKNGYEYTGKVPKINMNSYDQKQIWYKPYCFKMILAERSLNQWKAKGLVDRTFTLHCRPGSVKYSIKEVITENINKDPILQKLDDELTDFRKLMLCYRLVNYRNALPNIETGLKNRYNELCKPLLQFFCGTNVFKEITKTLQLFINQRKDRIENSIEVIIYPIIEDAVSEFGNIISARRIWELITGSLEGFFDIDRDGNKTKPTLFHSEDHGDLYMKTTTSMICDKFGAKLKHRNKGNLLVFDRDYLVKIGKAYDRSQGIQTLVEYKREPDRVAEVNSKISKSESSDSSDSTLGRRHANDQIDNYNNYKNNHSCIEKLDDLTQKLDSNKENTNSTYLPAESPESPESPVTKDLEFPFVVTSTGTKFYRCPFHIEGCRVQNIHPEEIEHHIQYKHQQK